MRGIGTGITLPERSAGEAPICGPPPVEGLTERPPSRGLSKSLEPSRLSDESRDIALAEGAVGG
jgi:hypothetical protein